MYSNFCTQKLKDTFQFDNLFYFFVVCIKFLCSLNSWFQSNMLENFPISYLQFNSIETEIVHNMQLSKLMKQQF